LSFKVG